MQGQQQKAGGRVLLLLLLLLLLFLLLLCFHDHALDSESGSVDEVVGCHQDWSSLEPQVEWFMHWTWDLEPGEEPGFEPETLSIPSPMP